MVSGINSFDDYTSQLPKNIPVATCKSALYSFAIATLFSGSIEIGATTAMLAATVTVISALTMPFFRHLLADKNGNMRWHKFAVTQIFNLALTQGLVNSLTKFRVNLVSSLFLTIFLTAWINDFKNVPTHNCQSYIFA